MRTSHFLLAVCAIAAAACSHDNPTLPTTPPPTGTATSSSGLSISIDTTVPTTNVVVGSTITVPVHVKLNGAAAPNVAVTWTVSTGGGTVALSSTLTDSTGLTAVNWTLGDTVQANTISAGITGASITTTVTTIAGPPSSIVKISPDSQAVVAGASLILTARTVDRFGNAAVGDTVIWTATGGRVSATSTPASVSGNATTNFTTDALPATYFVTAAVAGKASVTFKVVGL